MQYLKYLATEDKDFVHSKIHSKTQVKHGLVFMGFGAIDLGDHSKGVLATRFFTPYRDAWVAKTSRCWLQKP